MTTAMRYQLVLQFPSDSLRDYDRMVALEDELIDALGDAADVDGHDVGSGETNIFIFTSDPEATFQIARPVVERGKQLGPLKAAYREVDGEVYTVVWPHCSASEFRMA